MQILSVLPRYSGEWISVTDALPPQEASEEPRRAPGEPCGR